MELVFYPSTLLRVQTQEIRNIDDKLRDCANKMIDLMDVFDGVGLAAPQVGLNLSIFVTREHKLAKPLVFINPIITETSYKLNIYKEGCLSIPGIYFNISRPKQVSISAYDENEKFFTIENSDFLARIIQHEMDHLKGILFIDYLGKKLRNKLLRTYLGKRGVKIK